jgi:hypothetical protein
MAPLSKIGGMAAALQIPTWALNLLLMAWKPFCNRKGEQ